MVNLNKSNEIDIAGEVKRTGTGVLNVGIDLGRDARKLADLGFDKSPKDLTVLLINPPVSFDMFYGEWDMSDVKSSSPPLGILSLASTCRMYGYKTYVLDAHADGLSIPQIINRISEIKPDVVALTAMTVMISAACDIMKATKERDPKIVTILGGVHFTAEPIRTLERYPAIDFGIIGEGEIPFIEFLEKLWRIEDLSKVKSLVWRSGNGINANQRREFFNELDEFPPPAFDLVPNLFNHYRLSVFGTRKFKSVGLVTSRGCTGHCTWCDLGVVGRGYRYNTAKYLLSLMKDVYHKYGVTDFLFYDDLFVGSRPRLKEVCETIIRERLPFTWSCCARVDFMHTDMLALMKQAGCWMVEYGIESGSQRMIDSMKKNITLEKICDTIKKTYEAGIVTKGNFIFGHLGEDHDSIMDSIRFACSLKLTYVQHTFLTPLPGSETYEMASRYGTFDPSWDHMNTFAINFVPKGFTRADLVRYSRLLWRKFYLRPSKIWQELRKIHNNEDIARLWLAIKAFAKATIFRKKLPEFVIRRKIDLIH